jgi:lysophospholipase L1-like esterase
LVAVSIVVVLAVSTGCFAAVDVKPASPAELAVVVQAGQVELPGGKTVAVKETRLVFDKPETREYTMESKVGENFADYFAAWSPWPGKGKQGQPLAISLKPQGDEEGTQILGGLYRQLVSQKVTSADGSKTFVAGEDYLVHPDWAQIANKGGRLGAVNKDSIKITYTVNLQRLDLVQAAADGTVSVKKGKSLIVCPQLPAPDAGCAALAGIYIAPWTAKRNPNFPEGISGAKGDYAISAHEILVIRPAPPVAPVNKAALAPVMKKLADGGEVRIAFMGDSMSLGAEAGKWWDGLWTDQNLAFPSRVVVALQKKFPKAKVSGIPAFKGGTTVKYGLEVMDKDVIPNKPDLVVIAFGGNDVAGPVGKPPNNPAPAFKDGIRALIQRAKQSGAAVLLVVEMQQHPWSEPAQRWEPYRAAQLELAKEENVALADVYTEWMNQASRGTPPFTQLHNWVNHPGKEGHQLFAETLLRCFE